MPTREECIRWFREFEYRCSGTIHRAKIAGSMRRGKEPNHDFEIVIEPVWDESLLGEREESHSGIDIEIATMLKQKFLVPHRTHPLDGVRLKKFSVPSLHNFTVELYFADERNFGYIFAIRTGDSDFSRLLVTQRAAGGCLPRHLVCHNGYLKHRDGGEVIPCAKESDFFRAIGVPNSPPSVRSAGLVQMWRNEGLLQEVTPTSFVQAFNVGSEEVLPCQGK